MQQVSKEEFFEAFNLLARNRRDAYPVLSSCNGDYGCQFYYDHKPWGYWVQTTNGEHKYYVNC